MEDKKEEFEVKIPVNFEEVFEAKIENFEQKKENEIDVQAEQIEEDIIKSIEEEEEVVIEEESVDKTESDSELRERLGLREQRFTLSPDDKKLFRQGYRTSYIMDGMIDEAFSKEKELEFYKKKPE